MKYLDKKASLTPEVQRIMFDKGTEYPNFDAHEPPAQTLSYACRRCGLVLFRAAHYFHSGCGWPSFDDELSGSINKQPDTDGVRTEILCSRCLSHLGHVFTGEHFTANNQRHCVNQAALDVLYSPTVTDTQEAIVAGGCFWGVEHFFANFAGVVKAESGYIGGRVVQPTYEQICSGQTGHYEAVRVVFDTQQTNYQAIIKRFFEIHDPTQAAGQGPDIGSQYQSAIFCFDDAQRMIAQDLINQLKHKGFDVATKLLDMQIFWPAERYHQGYYTKHASVPYCHHPVARFER